MLLVWRGAEAETKNRAGLNWGVFPTAAEGDPHKRPLIYRSNLLGEGKRSLKTGIWVTVPFNVVITDKSDPITKRLTGLFLQHGSAISPQIWAVLNNSAAEPGE